MRTKAWPDSWPTRTGEIAGGGFAEGEAGKEELRETLRAGPGEAARREVTVGANGPAPSRWTRRTMRASVDWLTPYPMRGVWRGLPTGGLGLHPAWARLFSPDPAYCSQVRRRHRCLRAAARHPDTVGALSLDEVGYPRWPAVAPTGGGEAVVADRAGNNPQGRTSGALKALTGQVHYLEGDLGGRPQGIQFSSRLEGAYPKQGELIYGSHENWNSHLQPDVLTAWADSPRIKPVGLPTYAPWLTPLEKRWRWRRHAVLKRPRWVEDWPPGKHRGHEFLDQFAHGSPALLRYVGLVGKGKLASVIDTS